MSNYTNEAWHLDRNNVQALAEWLEGHCYWRDTRSVIAYYEKRIPLHVVPCLSKE